MSAPCLRSQEVVSHQDDGGGGVRALDESLSSMAAQRAGEWRHHGSGHHNTKHVRIHPKKLYGRSSEALKLLQAYRKMTDEQENNRPEQVIVISGADGVGKTALALTLRKPVTEDGGYFIRGKFDRLSARGQPYTAFLAAFKEFTSLVMTRGVEEISAMRDAIDTAVPEDSRILVEMIPSLENIMGSRQEGVRLPGSLAHKRFAFVFRKLLRAVCSPERPLVIMLDDIHYADQSSLDLLSSLIPEASSQGIMFVVTCKEPQYDSPLSKLLRRLDDASTLTTRIRLLNLHNEMVNSIVAEILDLPAPQTKHLSDFIYQETSGNANFVLEFIGSLQEKRLLRFDDNEMRWIVSEEGIYQEMESYNVGGLIVERITQQPQSLIEVLKVAACLGSTVNKLVLDCVFGTCVSRHLFVASECGFLAFDTQLEEYSFVHDAVQNASYSLIPKDEKRFFHLSIGRKLRRNFSTDEFEKHLFVVMNQFRLGADFIESEREKYALAELCLQTAERAVSASSFPAASLYLELGIWLLGEDLWKDHYALSLALFNTAAEVNYCTADFEREKTLLSSVVDNGRCFRDKLRAYESTVYMLGATDKMEEAMKIGLEVLEKLGESIPPYPKARRVKLETRKLKNTTDSLSNEAILRLRLMKDPDKLATLKMMSLIFLYAHLCRPQLAGFLVVRMMRLNLDGGLVLSSPSFVLYGMLLCSSTSDVHEGYRFGRLGLTLLEKFKGLGLAWLPRCHAGMACISPFTRPFRESQEPLKQSIMIGLEFGDIEYSLLNASLYSFNLIDAGRSLTFIEKELQTFSEIMTLQKQEGALALIRPVIHFVQNLTGRKHDLVSATGELCFDETSALTLADASLMHSFGICFNRTILAYLFGEYSIAFRLINDCQGLFQHPLAGFDQCAVEYWIALVSLALAATTTGGREKASHLANARTYMKILEKRALDSPHNLLARLSLLQAEEASVTGESKRAYAKYLVAISVAKEEQLVNEVCVAYERAGRHMLRLNDYAGATPFLQRSYVFYCEWGANVKAECLRNEFSSCITG